MTQVPKVAVVAHAGKTFGGGLVELRHVLEEEGIADPLWVEVPKSRKAPKQVKRALKDGAELLFVWGGDGTVQRCLDTVAGTKVPVAIVPAGTANLFATNLGIPQDIRQAVAIGLRGERRRLDVGRFNGERFGVMAGAGFDAAMIHDADGGLKDRLGRVAYVWTGSKNLRAKPFKAKISVDGASWYDDKASCILVGNVGQLFGGVEAFEDASPEDGKLELGVVNADGVVDWARTLARTAAGSATKSPFVSTTKARRIKVKLDRKVLYELDGGDREKVRAFDVKVEPSAVTVCLPDRRVAPIRMPRVTLVLGPLLRYAGTESATFWVETSAPCEVEILGQRTRTFTVEGHHYALLLVDDLEPDSVTPYEVRLDGELVWPPDDGRPRPVVRTRNDERRVRLVFGSCRVGGPAAGLARGAVARRARPRRESTRSGRTRGRCSAARRSGPTRCCCSATRSTRTRSRPRRSPSSRRGGTRASRPASRSPTSRSTRASTASRGRTRTSAGCSRPSRAR